MKIKLTDNLEVDILSKRTIIFGPPGTGKTHRLVNHYLYNELKEIKTESSKILYVSFSNAASDEARKRINKLYPGNEIIVSTLHSFGSRSLGLKPKIDLLHGKTEWDKFKQRSQICLDLDLDFTSVVDENGMIQFRNNDYMKVINYSRNKKIELYDAAWELSLENKIDIFLCEQINQDLIDYKRDFKRFEFSDMIAKFIEGAQDLPLPTLDAIFLDEAQDLSPLQWDMFFYLESLCKRSYIAGDDDQAIYAFQGASPEIFINLQPINGGIEDPQIKSVRVPKKIHGLATLVLDQISERKDKQWEPTDKEGEIIYNEFLENIDLSQGKWLILVRTNKYMHPIKDYLLTTNFRFKCKFNDLLPDSLLKAIQTWKSLNKFDIVTGKEVLNLYEHFYVRNKKHPEGQLDHGFKEKLKNIVDKDPDQYFNIHMLKKEYGLLVEGDWDQLNMSTDQKIYIKKLIETGDDLFSPERIRLLTMHGAKGDEDENVIVFTDINKLSYDSAINREHSKDTEHRLFFVAFTRAKERLFLMNLDQFGDPDFMGYKQYVIGEDIE